MNEELLSRYDLKNIRLTNSQFKTRIFVFIRLAAETESRKSRVRHHNRRIRSNEE